MGLNNLIWIIWTLTYGRHYDHHLQSNNTIEQLIPLLPDLVVVVAFFLCYKKERKNAMFHVYMETNTKLKYHLHFVRQLRLNWFDCLIPLFDWTVCWSSSSSRHKCTSKTLIVKFDATWNIVVFSISMSVNIISVFEWAMTI